MSTRVERVEEARGQVARALPFLDALGWTGDILHLGWIPDHLDEVVTDIQAFFRIDDPLSMPAEDFFRIARMLPAYSGAVAGIFATARMDADEAEQRGAARPVAARPTPGTAAKPREGSVASLTANPDRSSAWGTYEEYPA